MQKRRVYRPGQDDDINGMGPDDILDEQEQEVLIDQFRREDDQLNLIFKIVFTLLAWIFTGVYAVFWLNGVNPSTPISASNVYFESEILQPQMYQSCVLVSLLVTLFAPVFLHAPASFNPGVIPTKELSPWTGAYYIYLMVSVVPLAAMTSMRLPEASTQYTWAEYAFWGLPAITTLMIGYTAREMARVHIKIDELGDQKYELRGA